MLDFGLSDRQYPADLYRKYEGQGKRLLIVGGGRCVWDDIASLGFHPSADNGGYDVMCINDIVMHYPGKVTHFYSNDHRWIPHWLNARRELLYRKFGQPIPYVHSCRTGARYNWPWPGHGTSSLNGVYTGLAMGYERIVLAGVPLDDSGHYFDPPWVTSNFTREVALMEDGQMMYWANAKRRHFGGKVFSQSGRTRELLGAVN